MAYKNKRKYLIIKININKKNTHKTNNFNFKEYKKYKKIIYI